MLSTAFHIFEHVCTAIVVLVVIYVTVTVINDKRTGNRGIAPGW